MYYIRTQDRTQPSIVFLPRTKKKKEKDITSESHSKIPMDARAYKAPQHFIKSSPAASSPLFFIQRRSAITAAVSWQRRHASVRVISHQRAKRGNAQRLHTAVYIHIYTYKYITYMTQIYYTQLLSFDFLISLNCTTTTSPCVFIDASDPPTLSRFFFWFSLLQIYSPANKLKPPRQYKLDRITLGIFLNSLRKLKCRHPLSLVRAINLTARCPLSID